MERDCLQVLHDYHVLFVGVHCPLSELERRGRERGDRGIGQASAQLNHVHLNEVHDVEADTSEETLDAGIQRILVALDERRIPQGWLLTLDTLGPNSQ